MFEIEPEEQKKQIAECVEPLRTVCGVLAIAVGTSAMAAWMLVEGRGVRWDQVPKALPLGLTIGAMILILLSSRLRTTVLRRAFPRTPGVEIRLDSFLAAYRRATLASFATLAAAAALAVLVALFSGTAFYGMFLCLAAGFAMFTRWPSLHDASRLFRGRRTP